MKSRSTSGELKAMNFQVLPPLSAEDYAALKSDIAARGVQVPVEYDEEGNILDGHHRVQICGELGITTWPKLIRKGLTDTEKRTHARQLNLARRHLDQAARRKLIEEELRESPERSNRQIAASLGVSHPTVADVREQMESTGKIYQLEKTVGADGKERPAHKPIRTRFVDDSDVGKRETLEQAKEIRAEKVQERQEKARAAYQERKVQGGTVADLHTLAASGQKFGVIYADPPWSFEAYSVKGKERSAERHYDTQSLEDIKRLPVELLAADDCALMLWTVMPQLPGAIELIEAWGFTYKTIGFVWVKQSRSGEGLFTGMGYWTRANAEVCILATRGSPVRLAADVHQVIVSPVAEHSRKPDEARSRIERLLPGPYLELYGRRPSPNWTVWGNEVVHKLEAAE
jgi:N6-adenosine-specific RNA methylase IME4